MSVKVSPAIHNNMYIGTHGDVSVAEFVVENKVDNETIVVSDIAAGLEVHEVSISNSGFSHGDKVQLSIYYNKDPKTLINIGDEVTIGSHNVTKFELFNPIYTEDDGKLIAEIITAPKLVSFTAHLAKTSLEVGKTTTATVTHPVPASASIAGATFHSSDTALATINASGHITAIKAGSVTITITIGQITAHVTQTITAVATP